MAFAGSFRIRKRCWCNKKRPIVMVGQTSFDWPPITIGLCGESNIWETLKSQGGF